MLFYSVCSWQLDRPTTMSTVQLPSCPQVHVETIHKSISIFLRMSNPNLPFIFIFVPFICIYLVYPRAYPGWGRGEQLPLPRTDYSQKKVNFFFNLVFLGKKWDFAPPTFFFSFCPL